MPDQAPGDWFLGFRERWMHDVFTATAAVRLHEWEQIDDEALTRAAAWKREAAAAKRDDALNAAVMDGVLRLLARTKGEPPADTDLREAARRYLTTPPDEELVEAMEPLVAEMLPDLADLLGNVQAQLGDKARAQARLVLAGIAACLAMPRVDLQRASGRP